MPIIKKSLLPAVVFLTGAAVLVLEVVATRVLSPYFGNTIYTYSSIIGVILAALSLGYYFGGRLADKRPDAVWFYSIIFFSGLIVIILEAVIIFFLPILGNNLSIDYGPLITSMILFFLPALFLGTLSPFAIKLQSQAFPEEGIGAVSGTIYFWSTLGSIAGSLLTGFVFIPNFGVDRIIIGVGLALVLIGLVPLISGRHKILYFFLTFFAVILAGAEGLGYNWTAGNIVYKQDGVYEKLLIYDSKYFDQPARFFQQDRSFSSAMFLESDELVFDYSKYYRLYRLIKPEIKNTLVIGGGAYSIPKILLAEPGVESVEVVEIEPSLYELGKKYFRVPDDPRLENYIADGRRFLFDSRKKYDFIFSDVFKSLYSIPVHFTTEEYFRLVKSRLSRDGVFMINLIGRLDQEPPSLTFSEIKTFLSVFPNSYFFADEKTADPNRTQNIIFLGINGDKRIDFSSPEITASPDPIIRQSEEQLVDLSGINFNLYTRFTDNYAPIESLCARLIK